MMPDYQEPLNPVEVEQTIRRLANESAQMVRAVTDRLAAFREAERLYDAEYARHYLDYKGPAHERKYAAELATTAARAERDVAEVAWRYAAGRASALERSLSAMQTLNRTVTTMYGAAGSGLGG